MLKYCRLLPLKLALPSLILASWLAVAAELVDDGGRAACNSQGICSGQSYGIISLPAFQKHPALISLLDLPNRQPAGR